MSDSINTPVNNSELQTETNPGNEPVTVQDLADIIVELEQYRERLVTETLENAQKAKMMKSVVMAKLEPELTKIDAMLAELKERKNQLEATN